MASFTWVSKSMVCGEHLTNLRHVSPSPITWDRSKGDGMRGGSQRAWWMAAILLLPSALPAVAENTDPANDGSQWAWSENAGWVNAEPSGNGGPGVQVGDTALTGYLWGENAGWISLSCQNTGSCGTQSYGVTNNGCGLLAGYAWAENAGWISFSCANTGNCASATY